MEQTPLYPVIRLNPGKEEAIKRFHPWVFSGAIHDAAEGLQAGDTVTVTDYDGNILGTGFCESESIAVKMLCFDNRKIDEWFFLERLKQAVSPTNPTPTASALSTPKATGWQASSSTSMATPPWCKPRPKAWLSI